MKIANDAQFWDKSSRGYARSAVADPAAYERTLRRTRDYLRAGDHLLELGCGTGSTALHLADAVQTYQATDISPGMIAIAEEKRALHPVPGLSFRAATAETLAPAAGGYDAILGFNYLHLVRDVPATLRHIHDLLAPEGLFISKTACLGDMNPLIRLVLLPIMSAIGKAPTVTAFTAQQLAQMLTASGFDILVTENHASKGKDSRPFIVARKR
ncbi:ubiquinone biosynthesis protein UbiE [Devosia limi DSM 17137]|uniref:Ubiquinone biosynthesis protein UbiE n=1 Tax=Devosia limi DSM 17137 TaxID=1121477 RepID=A0A0F5LRU0_9HYPH|nr:class I SAM-dependent methyltransferase [Devosia limi]KKB85043.1 ubiquinone biosynthesis protein UbiE [Devosia limi DSM 17137]SHF38619.1 Ubiquinone/menaquinone biosynthesis C-methylase UbiE [Devosia limi DSM 17137]